MDRQNGVLQKDFLWLLLENPAIKVLYHHAQIVSWAQCKMESLLYRWGSLFSSYLIWSVSLSLDAWPHVEDDPAQSSLLTLYDSVYKSHSSLPYDN